MQSTSLWVWVKFSNGSHTPGSRFSSRVVAWWSRALTAAHDVDRAAAAAALWDTTSMGRPRDSSAKRESQHQGAVAVAARRGVECSIQRGAASTGRQRLQPSCSQMARRSSTVRLRWGAAARTSCRSFPPLATRRPLFPVATPISPDWRRSPECATLIHMAPWPWCSPDCVAPTR